MKKITLLIFIVAFSLQLNAQKIAGPCPGWLKTAFFYQLYPQSFKDTNGDGIGDINGIIEKLDYVKWLGCDAIWLNPCFESAFMDAGYDVIDFYKVAPRYGTNADLQRLFREAHKRNMHICLDLVAGHTSDQHAWFKASQKKERNEFSDRYIWSNDSTVKPNRYVSGKFERNGAYRKNFFDCQPALNYGFGKPDSTHAWEQPVTAEGPQRTRKELMKIMDFWMDLGADGFRVDMAPSLIKNDPGQIETNKLWAEIRNHFQSHYPEGILIAEWGNPARAVKAGFMMDFIIHLGNNGYSSMFFNKMGTYPRDTCYFSAEGNGTPENFVKYYTSQLTSIGDSGYLCVPTSNHDFQRPASGIRKSTAELKVAMLFFMTLQSVPLIYYGDEIGMRFIAGLPNKEGSELKPGYNRAGSRTPMQWNSTANAGFSTASPDRFYLPLDSDILRPNVVGQKIDTTSLLCFTRQLIAFRKKNEALGQAGKIEFLFAQPNKYPLVYKRYSRGQTFLVVVNPSGKEQQCNLTYAEKFKKITPLFNYHSTISSSGQTLDIATEGFSYGIYKIE